jgi:putative oxidoreductase
MFWLEGVDSTMLQKLIQTRDDRVLAIIRVTLGLVMFAHGCQKMLGWFGGSGFSGTMAMFGNYMHIPAPLAFLAIAAEFFGGLGLLLGLLGRVAAFGIAVNMVVAVVQVHLANGFFMNWTGQQKGEGFEYHLLVLAITTVVMLNGSGAWSLDYAIARRLPGSSI